MDIPDVLESILLKSAIGKDKLSPNEAEIISLFNSCSYWMRNHPEEETNLHPLHSSLIGEKARIYEHVAGCSFSKDSSWKELFSDWIEWLSDKPPSLVKNRRIQLEEAMNNPHKLAKEPYYLLNYPFDDACLVQMTFGENKFTIRHYAEVTPTLEPRLIIYNIQKVIHGGLFNISKVNPFPSYEPQQNPIFTMPDESPKLFIPLTKEEILRFNNDYMKNQELNSSEKLMWEVIHNRLFPKEGILFPEGMWRGIDEISLRMKDNPSIIPNLIDAFKGYRMGQTYFSVPETETFLRKLKEKTGIEKLEAMIQFSSEINHLINNSLKAGLNFRTGGLGETLVSSEISKERTLECLGDLLMQAVRSRFYSNDKKITKAFFGWIGRHLTKEFFPETVLSYNEHLRVDKNNRRNMMNQFNRCLKDMESEPGEYNPDSIREWFKQFRDFFGEYKIPGRGLIECCENPLELFAHSISVKHCIRDFIEDMTDLRSEYEGFLGRKSIRKNLLSYASSKRKKNWRGKEDFKKAIKMGFEPRDINERNFMEIYFKIKRDLLKEKIIDAKRDVSSFRTSYFRFIKDPPYQAGYYYAQKHIKAIMQNLVNVIEMPEKDLFASFMHGKITVSDSREGFFGKYDNGYELEMESRRGLRV